MITTAKFYDSFAHYMWRSFFRNQFPSDINSFTDAERANFYACFDTYSDLPAADRAVLFAYYSSILSRNYSTFDSFCANLGSSRYDMMPVIYKAWAESAVRRGLIDRQKPNIDRQKPNIRNHTNQ